MEALRDGFGRKIEYLRISVTDRCNFRCVYCMPETGMQWLHKSEILSYEEIAEVVRQLAPLGLRRLRITALRARHRRAHRRGQRRRRVRRTAWCQHDRRGQRSNGARQRARARRSQGRRRPQLPR